jgi:hypothetical protein
MPTLKNLSYGSLTIERPGSDPLTLGPRESAEISGEAFESDEVQRHLRDKRIAILRGAARSGAAPATEGRAAAPAREGGRNAPPTPTPAE